MDNTTFLLRGWRESLEIEATLNSAERQEYSRVVENYLLAREQRGWKLGVESAKNYIDLVEEKKLAGVRWEVGRRALRWLMDFMKKGLVVNSEESWQGQMERRLRQRQYAGRTVETYGRMK